MYLRAIISAHLLSFLCCIGIYLNIMNRNEWTLKKMRTGIDCGHIIYAIYSQIKNDSCFPPHKSISLGQIYPRITVSRVKWNIVEAYFIGCYKMIKTSINPDKKKLLSADANSYDVRMHKFSSLNQQDLNVFIPKWITSIVLY